MLRYFSILLFFAAGTAPSAGVRAKYGLAGVKTSRKFALVVHGVECASGNKRVAPNPTYLFTAMEANYTKLHENASNPDQYTRGAENRVQ